MQWSCFTLIGAIVILKDYGSCQHGHYHRYRGFYEPVPADRPAYPYARLEAPPAVQAHPRSQFIAVGHRNHGPYHFSHNHNHRTENLVAANVATHGYYDSVPYHESGNRYYTDHDPYTHARNFDSNTGSARYTVRTGSNPDAQDGPITAFASAPSRNGPSKFYVRDTAFYF